MFIKELLKNWGKDKYIVRIVKNSGIILAGTSVASGLNLASFAIMANELGPALLAVLVLSQTYSLILNDLFNVQTWESMIKYGAKDKSNDVIDIIFTNFLVDVVSAIGAFTFALLLVVPVVSLLEWDKSLINFISLYSISILFNVTTFTIGIPRLFDKFMTVAIVNSVVAAVKLGFVLAITYLLEGSLIMYIGIYLGAEIIINLALISLSFSIVGKHYGRGWWRRKPKFSKELIRFIWWTNLRTIIRIPVKHLDMIIVSTVMSMSTLGLYKVYKEIAGLIGRIGEPVNQAIFPEFAKMIGGSDIQRSVDVTKKTMSILFGIGLLICLGLWFISEFLIGRFFGEQYLAELNALYFMLILYGIAFFTVPINSLFIAAGFAKYSFFVLLLTNSIYLALAIGFGELYGIYGVLIAYGVQTILNKALKIYLMRKHNTGWNSIIR